MARWGEPRFTRDVDATIVTDFGEELETLHALAAVFSSRDPNPEARAQLGRLVLLTAANGIDLDVSLAAFPFELEVLERATDWEVGQGVQLRTCSAEDLVIYKLIAARPIDIHDVESIVVRQSGRLDVYRIRLWAGRFAEITERPELLDPFENVLKTVASG